MEGVGKRFNEASALQRRKQADPRQASHALIASMRPPLFSGGNARRVERHEPRPRASMRPPLFSGGNALLPCSRETSAAGFNEASALQRRKRASPRGVAPYRNRFNEASALQRRKQLRRPR